MKGKKRRKESEGSKNKSGVGRKGEGGRREREVNKVKDW